MEVDEEEVYKMGMEIKECSVTKDGVCALHGIEVERRKNVKEGLDSIASKMPFLLSSINKLLAFQVLLLVIMGGSYAYTRDVSQSAENHNAEAKKDIFTLIESINSIKIVSTRTDERYIAVLRELESVNRQINTMLVQISNDKREYRK